MNLLNQLLDGLPEELERHDEPAWWRWICVLLRSCAEHTSLGASLPSLPCELIGVWW
jgi:hypothetical protein